MTPTDRELMAMHLRALYTHDARGRIVLVNEPGGSAHAPRFHLGRTPDGDVWRLRGDLPQSLVDELEALCRDEPIGGDLRDPPRHVESYARLLGAHEPGGRMSMGPAYHFVEYPEPSRPLVAITDANAALLRDDLEDLVPEVAERSPFVAMVEGGRAVSVCRSVRITPEAHEAGVETLPEFRGRGHAVAATAGWARLVRSLGALPMYSTSWENGASQAVARKLRLRFYGADFEIT